MRKPGLIACTVVWFLAADLGAVVDRPVRKKATVNPIQEEKKQLEGGWDYAVSRGDLAVTIRDGVYTSADSKGNVRLAAMMKIDPTKKPKWLDMVYTAGPLKGQTLLAIYELRGDTLTLCIQMNGNERPTTFRGDATYDLCVLRRQRKAK